MVNLFSKCVLQFKMNEASGFVVYDTADKGAQLGTYYYSSGVTGDLANPDFGGVEGKINTCIFIPSDGFVSCEWAGLNFGTQPSSIAFWVKLLEGASNSGTIFCKRNLSAGTGYQLKYTNGGADTGKITWVLKDFMEYSLTSNGTINDGEWHFIVVTHASYGAMKIYIDNVLDNSRPTSNVFGIASTELFYIGNDASEGAGNFSGYIDCFSVFNAILTDEEIAFLYNAGNGTESLKGYEYRGVDRGIGRGILRGVA